MRFNFEFLNYNSQIYHAIIEYTLPTTYNSEFTMMNKT